MFGFQVSHGIPLASSILDFGSCSPHSLPIHVVWMNSWKHSSAGSVGDPSGTSLHRCCSVCWAAQSLAVAVGPCITSAQCVLWALMRAVLIACHKKLGVGRVKLVLLSNKRQIGINFMDLSLLAGNLWSYLFECQILD